MRLRWACAAILAASAARGQTPGADPGSATPFGAVVDDQRTYVHGLLEEFEGRLGADDGFRWEGEGWAGGDFNRLWLKTEGEATRGRVEDGQQELFYDRPVTTYFDLQAGGRYDLDSGRGRGWGALGDRGVRALLRHCLCDALRQRRGAVRVQAAGLRRDPLHPAPDPGAPGGAEPLQP